MKGVIAETTRIDTVRSGKGGQGRGMHRLRFGLTGSNIRSTWDVSGYFPLEFASPRREGGCFHETTLIPRSRQHETGRSEHTAWRCGSEPLRGRLLARDRNSSVTTTARTLFQRYVHVEYVPIVMPVSVLRVRSRGRNSWAKLVCEARVPHRG